MRHDVAGRNPDGALDITRAGPMPTRGVRGADRIPLVATTTTEVPPGHRLVWFLVNDRVKLLAYRVFDPTRTPLLTRDRTVVA
ncbi:MAG: hypothetical protein ACYDAN_08770 [Candidatus Limnocylindrales bacterium]